MLVNKKTRLQLNKEFKGNPSELVRRGSVMVKRARMSILKQPLINIAKDSSQRVPHSSTKLPISSNQTRIEPRSAAYTRATLSDCSTVSPTSLFTDNPLVDKLEGIAEVERK